MYGEIGIEEDNLIEFDYVNWKGEYSPRTVIVDSFFYGSNDWHIEPQWLMKAWDLQKEDFRVFAMKDMSNVFLIER